MASKETKVEPGDFEPQIAEAARRHGLDPDLVAIVVLLESRGNPTAKSPTGARGLMQIMPATAEEIAQTRGLEVPSAPSVRFEAKSSSLRRPRAIDRASRRSGRSDGMTRHHR